MGLRPLTAILEKFGVPNKVSPPPAGDRTIARYTGIDIPSTNPAGRITDSQIPSTNKITIGDNITIPTIALNTPSTDAITIPTIRLNTLSAENLQGTATLNTLIDPDRDIPLEIYNSDKNPLQLSEIQTPNPKNIGDSDIVTTAYQSGYQSQFGLIPIGAGSPGVTQYVLTEPTEFKFRKKFDSKYSTKSQFIKEKLQDGLISLYEKGRGIFNRLNGLLFGVYWSDYGHDRPDGGSSKQPYIVRKIGQTWAQFGLEFVTSINHGIWDAVRISKWLTDVDAVKGILFTIKQTGLQLSNPKLETTRGQRVFLPLMPTRIYNPLKLPIQLAGLPFGLHMPRHGILPDPPLNYEEVNKLNNSINNWNNFLLGGNRLLKYYDDIVQHSSIYLEGVDGKLGGWSSKPYDLVSKTIQRITKRVKDAHDIGVTLQLTKEYKEVSNFFGTGGKVIKEISGLAGPKSVFGIGWTDHRTYSRKFEVTWTNQHGAPSDVHANYRPVPDGRYIDVLRKADRHYYSMIVLTIKDVIGKDIIGSGVTQRSGGINRNGLLGGVVSDAEGDIFGKIWTLGQTYTPEKNYIKYLTDLNEEDKSLRSNLVQKISSNFAPGSKNLTGITGITDGTIIPGAKEMYDKISKMSSGKLDEMTIDGSIGFNAHYWDSHTTDTNIMSDKRSPDNFARHSYPIASRAGLGSLRRAVGAKEEGENGLWPDMHVRVGVQNTGTDANGIPYFDSVIADTAPSSNIASIGRDFVKVQFRRADSNSPVRFRAYIMGLQDKWAPRWTTIKYVGRPDEVYTYDGVSRQLSFSLIVAAESHVVMKKVYEKINMLARFTMPFFTEAGIMKGPLLFLTIGSIINNLPGFIDSLDFDFSDEYPWDIEVEKPMYIKVNISYTVINPNIPNAALDNWYPYTENKLLNAADNKIKRAEKPIKKSTPDF